MRAWDQPAEVLLELGPIDVAPGQAFVRLSRDSNLVTLQYREKCFSGSRPRPIIPSVIWIALLVVPRDQPRINNSEQIER